MLPSCGSQDMSSLGFQSKMFGGALISQVQVLKVEVPDSRSESFAPSGDALGFEFSPKCGSILGVVLLQDCASVSLTHFDVVFFLSAQ